MSLLRYFQGGLILVRELLITSKVYFFLIFKKKPQRIVIAGLSKSGTTALFFKIMNSVPYAKSLIYLFEPKGYEVSPRKHHAIRGILAKVLIEEDVNYSSFDHFDKKILLVRDPRDVIISYLLYVGGYHITWDKPADKILHCINLVRQKEKQPASVSVIKLYGALCDLEDDALAVFHANRFKMICNFHKSCPNYFIIKYEEFISNKILPLETYLEIKLDGEAKVGDAYKRVIRSQTSGNWKHWFTPEDVTFFKPLCFEYMNMFGYNFQDWNTKRNQTILPEHASEYVNNLIKEKRKKMGLPPFQPDRM